VTKYKTTPLKIAISINDESPIYGEETIFIEVQDLAAGWFLKLSDTKGQEVSLDFEQLDAVYKAAQDLRKLENA